MSKSRDIEFGDKNNLETGPKWAQFGLNYFFRMCQVSAIHSLESKTQGKEIVEANKKIFPMPKK